MSATPADQIVIDQAKTINELHARLIETSEKLHHWRSWAQFVFGGGGPHTADDDGLRAMVCAACDDWRKAQPEDQS